MMAKHFLSEICKRVACVYDIIRIFVLNLNVNIMPEIFRFYGYTFFFYSREHEPLHVHVEGKGGKAKYEWNGVSFVLKEIYNVKTGDQRRIEQVIEDNKDLIVKYWNRYFKDR